MRQPMQTLRRLAGLLLAAGLALPATSALATSISMPTPTGNRDFDSANFASAILAGPSGEFACFSGGNLYACNAAALQLAILGPDLTTGLTLGVGGDITLALPTPGSVLAIWEAGDFQGTGDATDSLVSVHTASGWSGEHAYGTGHIAPVLNDPQPSGYPTNFGTFAATDFGLAAGTLFDAVRIRTAGGATAHADLLAIAAVPEPDSAALFLAGVFGVGLLARRRMKRV